MPAAEVQTLPIISHALGEGKAVFVPLLAKGEPLMEMVRIYEGEVEAGLPSDSWGIPVVERCRKDGKERENGTLSRRVELSRRVLTRLLRQASYDSQGRDTSSGPHHLSRSAEVEHFWRQRVCLLNPSTRQASPSRRLSARLSPPAWDMARDTTIDSSRCTARYVLRNVSAALQ